MPAPYSKDPVKLRERIIEQRKEIKSLQQQVRNAKAKQRELSFDKPIIVARAEDTPAAETTTETPAVAATTEAPANKGKKKTTTPAATPAATQTPAVDVTEKKTTLMSVVFDAFVEQLRREVNQK